MLFMVYPYKFIHRSKIQNKRSTKSLCVSSEQPEVADKLTKTAVSSYRDYTSNWDLLKGC